ncbi:BRO family protein [Orbus sturtevantii]|uniref:BRO-N domain-containing protein n=1 Tax=Orbus sturtevantii TaxID=3074109 RepID=UPI00370DA157
MQNELVFNNTPLAVTEMNNQIWLTSAELAKALQYASSRAVTKIFNQNKDEFTENMTTIIEVPVLGTTGNLKASTRVFSLRGCHLIAMLSRTKIAKQFRKWVLDILDNEANKPVYNPKPVNIPYDGRWLVRRSGNEIDVTNMDGKGFVASSLMLQLQRDSAFYRNQLKDLSDKLKFFVELTNNYATRTRITTNECSPTMFDVPLAKLSI